MGRAQCATASTRIALRARTSGRCGHGCVSGSSPLTLTVQSERHHQPRAFQPKEWLLARYPVPGRGLPGRACAARAERRRAGQRPSPPRRAPDPYARAYEPKAAEVAATRPLGNANLASARWVRTRRCGEGRADGGVGAIPACEIVEWCMRQQGRDTGRRAAREAAHGKPARSSSIHS